MANGFNPFMLGQLARQIQQPGGVDSAASQLAAAGARPPQVPGGTASVPAPASPVPQIPPSQGPAEAAQPPGLQGNTAPGLATAALQSPALASLVAPPAPQLPPPVPAPSPVNPGGATGPAAIPGLNELIMSLLLGGQNAAGGLGASGAPGQLNLGQLIRGV